MMPKLYDELQKITAGRVLDMATRRGDFAVNLAKGLADFEEIIAIDIDEKALAEGREKFGTDAGIQFEHKDAYQTGYDDGSFDLVCIANSLHHLADLPALFREMRRLLAPGGQIIISELTADEQTGASLTHALLHGWSCDVDTALGKYHRHTYTRQEILDMVAGAGFTIIKEFMDQEMEQKLVDGVKKRVLAMPEKLERLKDLPDFALLQAGVHRIQENYDRHGAAYAVALVILAQPADVKD